MKTLVLSERELKGLLQVKYAASKEESKPILKGVIFCGNEVVAIDGYRISKRYCNKTFDLEPFVLDGTGIKEIEKELRLKDDNVIISIYENTVDFKIERINKITSVDKLEGYPIKYKNLMNNDYLHKINLNKENIKQLLEMVKESDYILQLTIKKNILYICDLINEKILGSIKTETAITNNDNDTFTIGINKKYLKEALKSYKNCSVFFNTSVSPIYFTEKSNSLDIDKNLELVLPVKIFDKVINIPSTETERINYAKLNNVDLNSLPF